MEEFFVSTKKWRTGGSLKKRKDGQFLSLSFGWSPGGTEELGQDCLSVLFLWSPFGKELLGVLDLVVTVCSMSLSRSNAPMLRLALGDLLLQNLFDEVGHSSVVCFRKCREFRLKG